MEEQVFAVGGWWGELQKERVQHLHNERVVQNEWGTNGCWRTDATSSTDLLRGRRKRHSPRVHEKSPLGKKSLRFSAAALLRNFFTLAQSAAEGIK